MTWYYLICFVNEKRYAIVEERDIICPEIENVIVNGSKLMHNLVSAYQLT
jgi:hypothetical protein